MEAVLRVGDLEVVALRDCVLSLSLDFQFPDTPRDAFVPFRARHPGMLSEDRWMPVVRAFLIRSPSWNVLFDTGIGTLPSIASAFRVSGALLDELRAIRCAADALETVVLSHIHLDHAGGVTRPDGDAYAPAFPRARYLLHRADLDLAREWVARAPAYGETVLELDRRGLLEDAIDGARVNDAITLVHTPGHTPGSMSLLVRSGNAGAMLIADVLPNPMLITEPEWRFGSDKDASQAAATRIAVMERIEREGLVAVPTHMPEPFGGFVRVSGKRYWRVARD